MKDRGDDGLVTIERVGRFLTRAEADVARSMLEANGVQAVVLADDASGVHPAAHYGYGGVALGVHPDDVDEVRELLDDVDAPIELDELRTRSWRTRAAVFVAVTLVVLLVVGGLERVGAILSTS